MRAYTPRACGGRTLRVRPSRPSRFSRPAAVLFTACADSSKSAPPAKRHVATLPHINDQITLGRTGIKTSAVGVGAWSWGDTTGYWGTDYGISEVSEAYMEAMDAGMTFIDTAESYGHGGSEELLGAFIRVGRAQGFAEPQVGTKFAPPLKEPADRDATRSTAASVVAACRASLSRLGLPATDLYSLHYPGYGASAECTDAFVDGLAECRELGLARAVGVCNFGAESLRRAHARLADRGIVLATNQVQFSLLYRVAESNGVMGACEDLGVTLVAYSPLGQGLLTGKYGLGTPLPAGLRAGSFTPDRLTAAARVVDVLRATGAGRGKSPAQVALNWLLCRGAQPIMGAKNWHQVDDANGARGWRLDGAEVAALDAASADLGDLFENPFKAATMR